MRKHRSFFWVILGGVFFLIGLAIFWPIKSDTTFTRLDVNDERLVANGKGIYEMHCATCHGVNLEGQQNWRVKGLDGLYPAPPHDDNGHTWHHPDDYLLSSVKYGFDRPGNKNNMKAYGKILNDAEIVSVLTFIKSHWSPEHQASQEGEN